MVVINLKEFKADGYSRSKLISCFFILPKSYHLDSLVVITIPPNLFSLASLSKARIQLGSI